jgi:Fic family protein
MEAMELATREYLSQRDSLTPTIENKELERLIIELSWKSSRIEGNTYTLLDAEKLIIENKEAAGHSRDEAKMILNHKAAFEYVRHNRNDFRHLTRKNIEELHAIMVDGLGVDVGFRSGLVGVTGSTYRPLDNEYQIAEAVDALSTAISHCSDPYTKALLALVGVSYIQPFADGNRRTSRILANAVLMANSLAPLSYRSVDEEEFRNAMLVFYELNSIVSMKKIFIEQYIFAAKNYAVR